MPLVVRSAPWTAAKQTSWFSEATSTCNICAEVQLGVCRWHLGNFAVLIWSVVLLFCYQMLAQKLSNTLMYVNVSSFPSSLLHFVLLCTETQVAALACLNHCSHKRCSCGAVSATKHLLQNANV